MEFKRGDQVTHYFQMPASSWSPGGRLYFAAKTKVDDDNTDSQAVITGAFTDSVAVSANGVVTYTLTFPPSATNGIDSGGLKKTKYLGEFQYVDANGVPESFPGNDQFIDVVLYFDIKRGTLS